MDTKESFLFRIFIEFQVLKSCDNGPVYFFFFFFLFAAQLLSYEFCHNSSFRFHFAMLFKVNKAN